MGVTNALYNYGFKYDDPDNPYQMEGFVNSEGAVEGLEYYKAFYDCCTPPGSSDWYMSENIDAYKSGQVALQMNFAFIWPGVEADPNVGGGKSGYFPNPKGPGGHFAQLGGQGISVVSYTDSQDAALEYIEWFAQPEIQSPLVGAGRLLRAQGRGRRPGLCRQPALCADLPRQHGDREGFLGPNPPMPRFFWRCRITCTATWWPARATAQEALDNLVEEWTEVFEDEGKI